MGLFARLFTLLFGLGGVLIAVGLMRTRQTRGSPKQKQFLAGRVPAPLPDGFYEGSADFDTRSWKGKTFSAVDGSGKNVFAGDDGTRQEQYPFRTYVSAGLQDREINVLKIDYDIPENPLWLRRVVDEVVEVGEGKLLGKVHVRLVPGLPFSLGYFRLTNTAASDAAVGKPAADTVPASF